jgi:hypothetical protein
MSGKCVQMFRTALIGAYVAIPFALAFGTYQGWLCQPAMPSPSNTNIAVTGLITLVAATMFAEHAGAFERAASGRDALIAIAYWLGAMIWAVAIVRLVPDNRAGATLLIGPMSALMLGGAFYLSRFAGMWTRSWTAAIMTATPMPVAPPISEGPASQKVTAWSGDSSQSDRVDVPANRGKIALKLLTDCKCPCTT